jgi:sporulation protein YlmC with PRC-barrel domain
MKKMSFVLTLTVLSAMLLAACGGGGTSSTVTPGVGTTTMPTLGTGGDLTPTVGSELGTPTMAGTMETTPSVEATTGTETVATLGSTETPQAGTGMGTGQFALLSNLLKMQVNGKDGSALGSIAGVVVNRPIPNTGADSSMATETPSADGTMATATPDASGGSMETATPTTDAGSGSTGSDSTTMMQGPMVTYLLLNKSGASSGNNSGTMDATATPAATTDALATTTPAADTGSSAMGSEVLVPWSAVSTGAGSSSGSTTPMQALTLSIDSSALANAPAFSSAMDSSVAQSGWDSSITQYWSSQGLQIPATGASSPMTGKSIVMRTPMQSMSVVDSSGQTFGQVADYVVDLTTGAIKYAVLSQGSGASESTYYLVPFTNLDWSGSTTSAGGLNAITLNAASSAFSGAPSITSLDNIDFSNLSQIDSYWMSQK